MIDAKQILLDVEILESEILNNKRSVDYKIEKLAKVEIQMAKRMIQIRAFCQIRKRKVVKGLKTKVEIQMTNEENDFNNNFLWY